MVLNTFKNIYIQRIIIITGDTRYVYLNMFTTSTTNRYL